MFHQLEFLMLHQIIYIVPNKHSKRNCGLANKKKEKKTFFPFFNLGVLKGNRGTEQLPSIQQNKTQYKTQVQASKTAEVWSRFLWFIK